MSPGNENCLNGDARKVGTIIDTTQLHQEDRFNFKMSAENIRIAVLGNVDAGKSTLIGTLTKGKLDNGRGLSRSLVMKHEHEIESGRTSAIQSHLVGYQENGESVVSLLGNKSRNDESSKSTLKKHEQEIASQASKLVTLMDLAGHEKYLKTTIHGISSGMIDYALLLVDAKQSPTHMTVQHMRLCSAFGIPMIIVITKIDGCPTNVLKNTKTEINNILCSHDFRKKIFSVKSEKDSEFIKDKTSTLTPIMNVSCVSGEGLSILNKLLFHLPKRRKHFQNKIHRPFEFLLEDIFQVEGVGIVVYGFVNAGRIKVGEKMYIGPFDDGSFVHTTIRSAHISRVCVSEVVSGVSACFTLSLKKSQSKALRSGMFGLSEIGPASRSFDAEIYVLKGNCTTITTKYVTMVHILHIHQSAQVVNVQKLDDKGSQVATVDESEAKTARPGDKTLISFRFLNKPEMIRTGMRVSFRDGQFRGIGVITGVSEN